MRDPILLSFGWLAAVVVLVVGFLYLDRWHQRRAWRRADARAREILADETEVDFVHKPRRPRQ